MAEASDTFGMLYQNLLDAGCDEETAGSCMAYAKQGEWELLPPLLARHRKTLLERLHTDQRQIDCLDFLLYRIERTGGI